MTARPTAGTSAGATTGMSADATTGTGAEAVTGTGIAASTPAVASGWMDELRWDDRGLITVVTQEVGTLKVLMVAWMNREALELTARTRQATYWSRSRSRLWRKGEESGHTQAVREIRADCDGDTLLLLVEQKGGIACHTGRHHCFFNRLDPAADQSLDWTVVEPVLQAPGGSSSGGGVS